MKELEKELGITGTEAKSEGSNSASMNLLLVIKESNIDVGEITEENYFKGSTLYLK